VLPAKEQCCVSRQAVSEYIYHFKLPIKISYSFNALSLSLVNKSASHQPQSAHPLPIMATTTSSSKQYPTFLLATGSFALPAVYKPLLAALSSSITLHIPHLPCVSPGRDQSGPVPPPTLYDDAAFLRKHLLALADEGKDVVLLAHSYGAVPATECLKRGEGEESVLKSEREKEGKQVLWRCWRGRWCRGRSRCLCLA
jgi:hypothetical protein